MASQNSSLLVLHEALFSLNIASALISALILARVFEPFVRFAGFLNELMGRKHMNAAGGYAAFLLSVAALAALLVLSWRLLRRTPVIRPILFFAAGLFAVGSSPACWFYLVRLQGVYGVNLIEAGLAMVCVVLYLSRKWPIPPFVTMCLLVIHYAFWGLRFWEHTHNPAVLLVPISGFLSCLLWGYMCGHHATRTGGAPLVEG